MRAEPWRSLGPMTSRRLSAGERMVMSGQRSGWRPLFLHRQVYRFVGGRCLWESGCTGRRGSLWAGHRERNPQEVEFIAPVEVYPGEFELQSLAEHGYDILSQCRPSFLTTRTLRNRIRLFESLCAHNLAAHAPALSKEPSVREKISLTHRRWFTDKWCVDKSGFTHECRVCSSPVRR